MSGPFGSPQWMYSSGFYPHEIGNSVRFDNTGHLDRTPSSAGDKDEWTFSAWVKRSSISDSGYNCIWGAGSGGVNRDILYFDSSDRLTWDGYTGSAYDWQYISTAKFRDPSAWYHIVVVQDTYQSTASNRSKVYVNGEQITAWDTATNPNQYKTGYVSNTNKHTIGATVYDSAYFDGYISEVNFVDGTALTPASFGETKADTWIPKKYTGSYGSLGYYLKFGNSGALGTDSSGNGHTWTATDIASTDQMLDSPTNNFATLNPVFGIGRQDQIAYSEGNLQAASSATGGNDTTSVSTISPSGKVYAEFVVKSDADGAYIGAMEPDVNLGNGGVDTSNTAGVFIVRGDNGYKAADDGGSAFFGSGFSNGDIIQVAVDTDAQKLWFGRNGTWGSAGNPSTGANAALGASDGVTSDLLFICGDNYSSKTPTIVANFGQDSSFAGNKTAQGNTDANGLGDFYYAPPAGFLALCTANLPDPVATINPAVNNSPQDHFNTVTFTANNGTQSINGVGFQPDFVWAKSRGNAYNHDLYDSVRGVGRFVSSNNKLQESVSANSLTSFDSDGFTLGVDSNANYGTAASVSWNWKAGGSGVSNTDGTITSTVSANTDAGFSIVTYTGNGSASATVGHGLGATPAMVIVKCRSDGADEGEWTTAHQGISGQVVFLNQTLQSYNPAVFSTGGVALGNSSAFSFINGTASVENSNKSGNTYVAYCFAEVEGFSKFGSYTGNGSTDGTFIHTGFRPAFVIVKKTSSTGLWIMTDNKRKGYNVNDEALFAEDNSATSGGAQNDFTSNGFKLRSTSSSANASGDTFIYIAFAETPFKYANAR